MKTWYVALVCVGCFCACGQGKPEDGPQIRIAQPKPETSLTNLLDEDAPFDMPGSQPDAVRVGSFFALADKVTHELSGELNASDKKHPRDQSYYDEYRLRVRAGAPVRAFVSSDDFDPFLYLFFADAQGKLDHSRPLMQNDDMQPGNRSAFLETDPLDSDTIAVVWVNSVSAEETGEYDLRISTEP